MLCLEAVSYTHLHFAAYSIARYQNYFPSHGGYGAGIANNDGGKDNMVAGGRSSRYVKGLWKVPSSDGNWSFSNIRYCNYFFENAVPKYEAGEVAGADADICPVSYTHLHPGRIPNDYLSVSKYRHNGQQTKLNISYRNYS